jgi:type I restriction enzyme S subunit
MVSTMTNVEQVKIPEGYKQAEVGGIPEDWIPLKLSDIAELTSSKRIFEGDYVQNGIPFYRGQEISQLLNREKLIVKCYISEGKYNFLKNRFGAPQRGDILITAVGTLGNAFLIDTDSPFYIKDGNLIWLRKVKPTVIGPYLIKQLEWHKDKIIEGAIGSSQKALTIVVLKKLEVPIPSIKEQTAIANALSDVDNLIASLETLIAKKSAIKTAAMQQLLTGKKRLPAFVKESEKQGAKQSSELDNTSETAQAAQTKQTSTLNSDLYKEPGEGLDEKSTQHSEVGNVNNKQTAPRPGYKQTELGEIPEDWEVKALGNIGDTIIGLTYSPNDVASFGSLVLRSSNVQKNRLAFKNNVFVEMDLPDRVIVRQDDILICVRNGSRQLIGKCALIDEKTAGSAFGAFMSIYRTEFSKFVFFQFQSNIIQNQINEVMGATINQITNKDMAGFKIPMPKNKDEQTAITGVLFDIDAELDGLQQRLSKTQKIKQGMMQELLTGKTRLV